jgi:hypothetical protein
MVAARQIGVWNFDNNLNNALPGQAPLSIVGSWSPFYSSETINGSSATVLSFPAFDNTQAVGMPNQAGPNGGGATPTTNNWSIVMDVKFPVLSGYTGLWETGPIGGSDGDYFIRDDSGAGSFGSVGISGQYSGFFEANVWNRLAVTVDTTTNPGTYTLNGWVNGVLAGTATTGASPAGRQGIRDVLHLFADEDLETSAGLINSLAYYGEVLSDTTIQNLGFPTASGIPSSPNQAGLWNFNNNLNNSIVGRSPLAPAGAWSPTYVTETIGGAQATVLSFPAFDNTQALDMPNEAPADDFGAATTTNVWTIVMDVKFPVLSGFTGLWETDDVGSGDGDYFIRDDSGAGFFGSLGISGQYSGVFDADRWTRLAVTVDGSAGGSPYVLTSYVDGVLAGTATTGNSPNGRQAVKSILNLFADEDGETSAGSINSLAFYDVLLTEAQIAALGGATASGIPVEAVQPDADFNGDGQVDGRDLLAWQRGFGLASGASRAQGDADGNGIVNAADLAVWGDQFGSAAAAAAAIPEPAAATLIGVALLSAACRRRRRTCC